MINLTIFRTGVLPLAVIQAFASAAGQSVYEPPPILAVEDVLDPSMLNGPHHKVDSQVPVHRFGFQFTVTTNHGDVGVWSKEALNIQIRELAAIEKLKEISQTKAFATSIAEAAKNPLVNAWAVASKPVSTIKGLPGGATRYFKGALYKARKTSSELTVKVSEAGKKKDPSEGSDESLASQASRATSEASREHLGFNKAKRAWAKRMKVDPYSDNSELQSALGRIAWATALGSFAADYAIPSYAPLNYTSEVQSLVWETPPLELERQNDERLRRAGLKEESILALHNHPVYRISGKTAISLSISHLQGVEGIQGAIDIILGANDRFETVMMLKISAILSNYHRLIEPLDRIEIRRGMITAIDGNGALIFPVAVEYLHWTELAEEIADDREFDAEQRQLWMSGQLSTVSKQQLAPRGWRTIENCFEHFSQKENKE